MMGFPIEKAKELINHALDELYPGDTFNLITFSGDTRILFPEPVFPTVENILKTRAVLNAQHGGGGTEMMKAIRAALAPSDSQDHLRVVCFLTDGYVGNDLEIIGEAQKHPNARVFAYGVGNSVNRFLIESNGQSGPRRLRGGHAQRQSRRRGTPPLPAPPRASSNRRLHRLAWPACCRRALAKIAGSVYWKALGSHWTIHSRRNRIDRDSRKTRRRRFRARDPDPSQQLSDNQQHPLHLLGKAQD
jgi:hypothetical protein